MMKSREGDKPTVDRASLPISGEGPFEEPQDIWSNRDSAGVFIFRK